MIKPSVGVSNKHHLVNLYLLRVRLGWCTKGHKVYIGSGRMSLHPVCCCSCYWYRKGFVVEGTNGRERDMSQVSDGKVERMPRAWLLLGCVLCVELICSFSGTSRPPFYKPRGSRDYRWEKEEKLEVEKVLRRCRVFLFP